MKTQLNKFGASLAFLFLTYLAHGQSVSGLITDIDGIPLGGATVIVKGTTNGVSADFDGNYTIGDLESGNILIYSFVGYKAKEIIYSGQEEINVALIEDLFLLDEVVIATYGTQKNTPVSSIRSEELSEFPTTDIGQALQGRAAGVTITNGGSPGSQTLIQIRGTNTFGDGTPLFVVDGVFTNSIASLDLSNVEKIDVLKDAASLAIYGSRGTNGVILITTKKGKAGRTSFSINASSGVQEFFGRYDLLNTEQYIRFLREINTLSPQNGGLDAPVGRINNDPTFDGNGIETDWQEAYFRQAPIFTVSANVNGGSENVRFNVGYSRLDQEGVFVDTGFTRNTLNINLDANIGDWLEIGQTLALGYNRTIVPEFEGGRDPLQNIIGSAPFVPVREENGQFGGSNGSDANDSRNQIRVQDSQDNLARFSSAIGSIYGTINLAKGLKFRSQFGLDANLLLQDNIRRSFAEAGGRFLNATNFVDQIRRTVSQTVFVNTLTFDRTFGKHAVNGSAVAEFLRFRLQQASLSDNNEISSQIPEIFSPNARATTFTFPENLNSLLFLAGYEWDNRLSISGSARRDTSSRFSPENASDWFFSAAVGWDVTNEPWFKVDAINSLKLRASFGESGNNRTGTQAGSVNQFLPTLGVNFPVSLNNQTSTGIRPNNAANPDLRWETQIKQNYGLSASFLNGQIQFGADYFRNRSEDLLVPVALPSSAGIPGNQTTGLEVIRNAGDILVEGVEFTFGYNDFEGDFKWNVSANLTMADNVVESTGPSNPDIFRAMLNPPFSEPLNRLAVGEAPFHFFGLVADGVFSTQEQIDSELPNNGTAGTPLQPGDVRFLDLNGDGEITPADRTVIGDPNPDFTYALNFHAEYKGWDFDVLFNGVQGVDIFNTNTLYLEGLDNGQNFGTQVLRRWQNPGDITDIPRFRFGDNINTDISTRYIEDGSYLRLRNLTIGYTFPTKFLGKLGEKYLKKLRFYVQGQNILTLTNYSGLDPETAPFFNSLGLVDGIGIDRSAQPRPVTVISGIQIDF